MKSRNRVIALIGLFLAVAISLCGATSAPRILTLANCPYPKAEVQSLDPATGSLGFRWLNADGQPVDSGGSVARFTPLAPLPADPEQPNAAPVYPEVSDETLAAAISAEVNTPAVAAPRRQETRIVIARLTDAERASLFGSTNTSIRTLVAIALATGVIRDDDPDFATGVAGLNALGIIATNRWDALLAP